MSDLVAPFRAAGHRNVRTHGQSGNVLFEADHVGGTALQTAVERTPGSNG
ncbi:DUF1697 domain-containing protein [Occultella kanbiaonis]